MGPISTLALFLFTTLGYANSLIHFDDSYFTNQDEYYEVEEVSLELVDEEKEQDQSFQNNLKVLKLPSNTDEVKEKKEGSRLDEVNEIIAIGKEIYKIVEAGKPQVVLSSEAIDALPKNDQGNPISPFSLENWSYPKTSSTYQLKIVNRLGMTVIDFRFKVIFTYGGSLNGKGAYLSAVQIKPVRTSVAWGFGLEAQYKLQNLYNQGTRENPVAAMNLLMDYSYSTIFYVEKFSQVFFVNGRGALREL